MKRKINKTDALNGLKKIHEKTSVEGGIQIGLSNLAADTGFNTSYQTVLTKYNYIANVGTKHKPIYKWIKEEIPTYAMAVKLLNQYKKLIKGYSKAKTQKVQTMDKTTGATPGLDTLIAAEAKKFVKTNNRIATKEEEAQIAKAIVSNISNQVTAAIVKERQEQLEK